jgi:beta-phosphoglucomutase-like phosphatase (HAD superfamily)
VSNDLLSIFEKDAIMRWSLILVLFKTLQSLIWGFSPFQMSTRPTLFLDFDGTVAETEPLILEATNLMLTQNSIGVQITFDEYSRLLLVGNTEARLTSYFNNNDHCWPVDVVIDERGKFVNKLKREKDAIFKQLVTSNSKLCLRPGILKLMEEVVLELEGDCCIVSNTDTEMVSIQFKALIEANPQYHYLLDSVRIVGGDAVAAGSRKKPAPDLYQYAAAEVVKCDIHDVVVVEDSNDGLTAALAAGVSDVIITKSQYTANQDFTGATLVLADLEEKGPFSLQAYLADYRHAFTIETL